MVSGFFLSYGSSATRASGSSSLTMNSSTQSSFCWYSGSVSKSHTVSDATTLAADDNPNASRPQGRRLRTLARARACLLRRPGVGLDHARPQGAGSESAEVLRDRHPPPPPRRRRRGGGHRRVDHRRGRTLGSAGPVEAVRPRAADDAAVVHPRIRSTAGTGPQARWTARADEVTAPRGTALVPGGDRQ